MSSRPQFNPTPVITNGDMSSNITSLPTIIQKLSELSYDVSWTGTSPVGTLTVQVSNTYAQNSAGQVSNPGNWTNLPLAGTTVVAGSVPIAVAPGNGFIDIDDMGGYAVRLVYTATSGTGTLNAVINGKVS
jgi:hypothetical protein